MKLNDNDVANLERGIDAGIQTILGMAQESMIKLNHQYGGTTAGPFVGFIQALVEHRPALSTKALEQALIAHPDLGDAEVQIVEDIPDDA